MSTRKKTILLALFFLVAFFSSLPFLDAGKFGFTGLDDRAYCTAHKEVVSGLNRASIAWAFSSMDDAIWMPLTRISYMADYSLFKGTPSSMHLHSVVLHGFNGGLLFILLSLLAGAARPLREGESGEASLSFCDLLGCASGALVWAVHPLRCESVAWIASRKDVLSMFWEFLALILWVRMLLSHRQTSQCYAYIGSLACFGLSALAKQSCMTFPILVLILDFFGVDCTRRRRTSPWAYLLPTAMALAMAAIARAGQSYGGAMDMLSEVPITWRISNAIAAYGCYLFHSVWPVGLAVQCIARYPAPPRFLQIGIVATVATAVFVIWRLKCHTRRGSHLPDHADDWPLAGVLFFAVAVLPFLGLSGFGFHAYADRFTYVPSVGLSLLVV